MCTPAEAFFAGPLQHLDVRLALQQASAGSSDPACIHCSRCVFGDVDDAFLPSFSMVRQTFMAPSFQMLPLESRVMAMLSNQPSWLLC